MKGNGSPAPRPLAVGLACVAPLALICIAAAAQPDPGQKPPMAAEQFKNIQVLKDLPANQLIPLMHNFNDSLGVGCDFCHVVDTDAEGRHTGWEKDRKKPKAAARRMIVMMQDMNAHQRALERKGTCFMCHHGHKEPETKAPVEAPPAAPAR